MSGLLFANYDYAELKPGRLAENFSEERRMSVAQMKGGRCVHQALPVQTVHAARLNRAS